MKIAIVSGPTGGHFFPALSIADGLVERGFEIKFFIPERDFIISWLEKRNYEFKIISEVRFSRKEIFFPFKMVYAIIKSISILKRENFSAIVGTGSYATFPVIIAGKILKRKIYLHEQNYLPGKVTKICSRFSDKVFLTFPYINKLPRKKTFICGFPIPDDFKKKKDKQNVLNKFSFDKEKKILLAFGGSQSASFINRLIISNFDFLMGKNFHVILIAGREKEKVKKTLGSNKQGVVVLDFYFEMNELYSIADAVISRAGAGTLSELTYWKIPAILIPYPHAGNHQFFNALFLEKKGCGMIFKQKEENIQKFPAFFEEFLNKYEKMKKSYLDVNLYDEGKILDIISDDLR